MWQLVFWSKEAIEKLIESLKKTSLSLSRHYCTCDHCDLNGLIEQASCSSCDTILYGSRWSPEHREAEIVLKEIMEESDKVREKWWALLCKKCDSQITRLDWSEKESLLRSYIGDIEENKITLFLDTNNK